MLFILPIEPLEERYSADWLRWTQTWAKNVDSHIIHPQEGLYKEIKKGQFLDVAGTNIYKSEQLRWAAQMFDQGRVKDGDIFWVHDLWFPGIEMLAYMRDGLGLDVKIFGMLHAGCYDEWDFLSQRNMNYWGQYFERVLLNIATGIFVATKFHKNLICKSHGLHLGYTFLENQIHVVGFPLIWHKDKAQVPNYGRRKLIVFPHRIADEKGWTEWLIFKKRVEPLGYECIATKEVCKTKQEYYDLLKQAMFAISFAKQETWGIAMQESVLCGCIPIVPNALSYREMYPYMFRYELKEDPVGNAINLLRILVSNPKQVYYTTQELIYTFTNKGQFAFDRMYALMMSL